MVRHATEKYAMRAIENSLGDWIRSKYGDQDAMASKLGITRAAVSAYKTGRNDIPPKVREAIRKLGYEGPWPREEAQEAAAGASVGYATIEEVAELRGAMKAHVEYLERALEKMGEAVRLLLLEREQSRQKERP